MPNDIRMRGFRSRAEVPAVLDMLKNRISRLESETIGIPTAYQRILAADVISEINVPGFRRAAMDGYAINAEESFGASDYNPLEFEIIGEAFPGRPASVVLSTGSAVRIMTGAPVPDSANAVIPAEFTSTFEVASRKMMRIVDAIAPEKNVGKIGEDIAVGTKVLNQGRCLRPQDLGVLASIGASPVSVVRQPRVHIFVTGDELLPCGEKPTGHQIVDSNSVMLKALLERDGGLCTGITMLQDNRAVIVDALAAATDHVLLISGGSSVGLEDHTPGIVRELGELTVHGMALRPASPTGIGFFGSRPVFLLPGNPVSSLCAYDLFAGPTIRVLGGRAWTSGYRNVHKPLAKKIASEIGRWDYVRVQIQNGRVMPLAISGASILSSTTRADGYVLIPGDLEGFPPDTMVEVFLYDRE